MLPPLVKLLIAPGLMPLNIFLVKLRVLSALAKTGNNIHLVKIFIADNSTNNKARTDPRSGARLKVFEI
jgi:hypothetical protein